MHHSSWQRRRSLLLLAAGLLVPLGACGDDDDDDAATDGGDETEETAAPDEGEEGEDAASDGATITISGFAFSEPTVSAGSTVAVVNEDGAPHTVTSDDDAWEEVEVSGGEEGELTAPAEPGDYDFHCEIHSTMTGTLVVE